MSNALHSFCFTFIQTIFIQLKIQFDTVQIVLKYQIYIYQITVYN